MKNPNDTQNDTPFDHLTPLCRDLVARSLEAGHDNATAWSFFLKEARRRHLLGPEQVNIQAKSFTIRRTELELAAMRGEMPPPAAAPISYGAPAMPVQTPPAAVQPQPPVPPLCMADVAELPPAPVPPTRPPAAARPKIGLGLPGQRWGIQPVGWR
jgi:hypothetical protein